MYSQFGDRFSELRETQHLFLRHVAALLAKDTAQLSKIEKVSRLLKREQIPVISTILIADEDELLTLWLADQIYAVIKDEDVGEKANHVAENQLQKNRISF